MKAYQFKITLKDTHPPIWRRCIVPQGLTFSQLSVVFNIVMGWDGSHLSGFDFPKQKINVVETNEFFDNFALMDRESIEADKNYIDTYVEGEAWFTYTYDFGDDWTHKVVVEEILNDYAENYPEVVKYKGDCPPEDCGGVYAFEEFLQNGEGEDDSDYEEILEAMKERMVEYCVEDVNEELEDTCFLSMNQVETRNVAEIYEDLSNGNFGLFAKVEKGKEKTKRSKLKDHLEIVPDSGLSELNKKNDWQNGAEKQYKSGDALLKQCLCSYKISNLLDIAQGWNLVELKSLSKNDVIEALVTKMLEPGTMEKYFLCLSKIEMASLQRVLAAKQPYVSTEDDDFYTLYNTGYIFQATNGVMYLPKEVVDFCEMAEQPSFLQKRERQQWILACINAANMLYGITPFSVLLDMINIHEEFDVVQDDLLGLLKSIPLVCKDFILQEKGICAVELEANASDILQMQGDVEFYLPSQEEVFTLQENPVVSNPLVFDKLVDFLEDTFDKKEAALAMSHEIEHLLAYGMLPADIYSFLQLNSHSTKMTMAQDSLFMEKINMLGWHTRTLMNRGFTPEEIAAKKAKNMPLKKQGDNVVYLKKHQKKS